MITVGQPTTIFPPCAVLSPILAAGLLDIRTLEDPIEIVSGGPVQVHRSPRHAANCPPMNTVVLLPGRMGPPTCGLGPSDIGQMCISFILAAAPILIELN